VTAQGWELLLALPHVVDINFSINLGALLRLERPFSAKLSLVSAPAGYGKSTLVSQWLELLGCRSVWLSLDAADSDLTQFLSYVVAALHGAVPGCCADTAENL
jgi:LuxR family maltose regulon positive regulatory protein